ncbi:hypothetical protein BA953_23335 [Vibrio coralliilyticus]|uniref:DUF2938 domain-containing protein n=1 Tax=Vibrio coralliilyticus TaxID=190893 RepID=UPI0008108B14|nr:DUF2938 domain-containing protein [Vibrio coralliilyticus]ANW27057.1 hypothetical protein BA953_23335 [Vibrio coralliilyticus]
METHILLQATLIGIGATIIMDLWGIIQKRILGIPPLNYGLVARWVVWIPKGKWMHQTIMNTPSVWGENALGWLLHYLIGVIFAIGHVYWTGETWLTSPTVAKAWLTGLVTLVFPYFIIQPCLGFGIAASKKPKPWLARTLSLFTHSAYGVGLFFSAQLLS